MKAKNILSPFPFYGGKAEMARIISDMLDYHATYYIEPYGGSAKVLLNKPRHSVEIYNDTSLGLCAFMNLMSREDTAWELIRRIYETEYNRENFKWALEYKNSFDVDISKQLKSELETYLRHLFVKYNILPKESTYREYREVLLDAESVRELILPQCSKDEMELLMQAYENYETNAGKGFDLPEVWNGMTTTDYLTNYDLAVATYIVYVQSRDGMGKYWSSEKFKGSADAYINQVDRLYDVAERMNGVHVPGALDALLFIKYSDYLNDSDAMFYLDPAYISVDKEKDLGKAAYKTSYSKNEHIELLEIICEAKAKVLLSNYDAPVFSEYLTPERGWKRYEYATQTALGREGERERLEVLWYNY